MNHWHSFTIGDLVESGLADVRTGPFGTQLRASDYASTGVPVLNVRNLGYGNVRRADIELVDSAVQRRLSAHILCIDDIVFGRKGAVDRHVLIGAAEAGWMQGSDCIRLRLTDGAPVAPAFLSKALLTPSHKAWIEAQCSHGATMASLNQRIIDRIELTAPDFTTQMRIAAVLGAFDELIEINARRIELLEHLARSLYHEWFVQLRFPGHEQSRMTMSDYGEIPDEWTAGTVADFSRSSVVARLRSETLRTGTAGPSTGTRRRISRVQASDSLTTL